MFFISSQPAAFNQVALQATMVALACFDLGATERPNQCKLYSTVVTPDCFNL